MIAHLLYRFTYLGLFGLLIAAGLGVPIPEDATLLTGGFLASQGITSLWLTLIVGYAGVLIGDVLIFRLGQKLKEGIYTHQRLAKLFTPRRRAFIEEHFRKRGVLTVVIGRHTPGLRAPSFLVAGASGMPTWKFVLADALSAMLTVPAVTYLGYLFANNLEKAKQHMRQIEVGILVGLAAVGLAILAYHSIQRRRERRREAGGDAPQRTR